MHYNSGMDTNKIIDSIGGTGKVAQLCGITSSAVTQWRTKGMPKPWQKYLRKIRPKAFLDQADTVIK